MSDRFWLILDWMYRIWCVAVIVTCIIIAYEGVK